MTAPSSQTHLRLADLIGALSHALDLTEGQPRGHCIRCCWIGFHVGKMLGYGPAQLSDLYYTLLLKDLGCSSNAARICQLYLADDRNFKRDFKLIDGSLPQALRFVLGHTGLTAPMAERFRAIINILKNGGEIARELMEARCHRGAEIAARMRFSPTVCSSIQALDEHWDGSGKPEGRSGKDIPQGAQIALLAQVTDVFFKSIGRDAAIKEVVGRAGSWFDPLLTKAFAELAADPRFWDTLDAPDLPLRVLALEPQDIRREVDDDYLDDIALAFAKVIDAKSPYTAGHSERVAVFADLIAEEMGETPEMRRTLRRAALLHDVGKLGISNTILDKPGKLTDEEFAEIRKHPVHSGNILSGIPSFRGIAEIGRDHHEKLDGKGYPYGISGSAISHATRIVSLADIFDALTAERPYRGPMPVSQALGIMEKDVGRALDGDGFEALVRSMNKADAAAA
ncbi:HD-GYP domain-containing protein [Aestuariivirga sp.]|uniref:HD-GYP domain-containing protein n=1 Tax=Aestuariivirga sp. TaxID=2650926 RepID=UPI0039E6339E